MIEAYSTKTSTENSACLVGRVLLSLIFIWSGYGKLMAMAATTARFGQMGLPVPPLAFGISVLAELGGGLLLLAGLFTRASAAVLLIWCFATALVAHTDFADRNMEIHFMKNVAIAGGLAYVIAFGAGAFSLDALRRRSVPGVKSLGVARS